MFELFFLVGLLAVASNPSPYYGALGLIVGAMFGSLILFKVGVTFLSLVLLLVYLGGMMVVFAYSTALVASPYPEAWGNITVLSYMLFIVSIIFCVGGYVILMGVEESVFFLLGWEGVCLDWLGVSQAFNVGGWILILGGFSLLLTLVVVFEVVRGRYSGVLRAV